jgi:MYXO-CTERM domain-containing protein
MGVSCLSGQVCVETTGHCEANACEVVRCQTAENCIVQADGHPECVLINKPNVYIASVKPGSRGLFGCSVAGGTNLAGSLVWLGLALLALARLRRR